MGRGFEGRVKGAMSSRDARNWTCPRFWRLISLIWEGSAVNLSEVVTKAIDTGMTLEEARLVVAGLPCEIVPFDVEQAFLAAALRGATRSFGLSLGDRACLALGLNTGHPVVTADRVWDQCDVGVQVIRIR
jgi:PIN domain nuclease of toxin-antitoxin system